MMARANPSRMPSASDWARSGASALATLGLRAS